MALLVLCEDLLGFNLREGWPQSPDLRGQASNLSFQIGVGEACKSRALSPADIRITDLTIA
jgi:hypothetical protein